MNRRGFLKFLGIGVATATVAPQVLAETKSTPQIETGWMGGPAFTPATYVTDGIEHGAALPLGRFMYVKTATGTMPFRVGDVVRYKVNKKGETIAFRTHTLHGAEEFGVAVSNVTPGQHAFIKIAGEIVSITRLKDGSLKAI